MVAPIACGVPGHLISVTLHPQYNCSWVPYCSLGPPEYETKVSSIFFCYVLCENAWFPWQPIADLREGYAYKSTHSSAVIYPRLLNLIPN